MKLYFNVGIDDKFGFEAETDWVKGIEASISLYRKLGFKEIPLSGNAYERCDILMELVL